MEWVTYSCLAGSILLGVYTLGFNNGFARGEDRAFWAWRIKKARREQERQKPVLVVPWVPNEPISGKETADDESVCFFLEVAGNLEEAKKIDEKIENWLTGDPDQR